MTVIGIVFELVIVLAEQIFSVVIAVRRSHNRMNVAACRGLSRPVEGNGTLMVEFDLDDRAMDSVVKDCVRVDAALPGKIGLVRRAASSTGAVETPVFLISYNPSCGAPSLVIPKKGSASARRANSPGLNPPCCWAETVNAKMVRAIATAVVYPGFILCLS